MMKITLLFATTIGLFTLLLHDKLKLAVPSTPDNVEVLAKLPKEVDESSGIVAIATGVYLTHNDSRNKPYLYKQTAAGKTLQTIRLNLSNVDWEDITKDDEGNLYIADTGNNKNNRQDLAIYKVSLANPEQVKAIRFSYEDQKEFPPKEEERNFDSEALFWDNDKLYLVSKDRGRGETAKLYQLPDEPGSYEAQLIGSTKLETKVTAADISPDGKTVVLLGEEELHLFRNYNSVEEFYEGDYEKRDIEGTGKTEAVAFEEEDVLVITSEGGSIYRHNL
ncbi:hypothetical protein [Pontibacter korlensis]|nr:hypothetical protein [Pontibacter korlensis]